VPAQEVAGGLQHALRLDREAERDLRVRRPTSAADDLAETAKQLDKTFAELPWLNPVAARIFVGAYDPAQLRFTDRLLTKLPASPLHGLAAHDDRDWQAIGEWAAETAEALEKAALGAGAAR
jgi:menaquinone-dependent protoporphyrinogen IX oxidase